MIMAEEKDMQGGFPQQQSQEAEPYSTTGDGHPPRTGERSTQEGVAGQGLGQMGGQSGGGSEMGGTGSGSSDD